MNQRTSIKDLKILPQNEPFETFVGLRKITSKTGRTGNLFLSVEVFDATGHFTFNGFPGTLPFSFLKDLTPRNQILHCRGQTDTYGERFSPRITDLRSASPEESTRWAPEIFECPRESIEALKNELSEHIEKLEHAPLKATVKQVFEDLEKEFNRSFAAISMHHAYRHGLLEHTVHVTRLAGLILPLYPQLNADLVRAGTLLHDVGKALEYTPDGTDRTPLGRLQGHVILGYRTLRQAALRHRLENSYLEELEHIVLSHQGQLEWGAAVLPSTPEAVFVALLDNLNAKMAMVEEALRKTPSGQLFSDFISGLQTRVWTQSHIPERSSFPLDLEFPSQPSP
jgi:3'-5' exoribonuclease